MRRDETRRDEMGDELAASPSRKSISIVNFSLLAVVMFIVLSLSLIFLGSYGLHQVELNEFYSYEPGHPNCVLYITQVEYQGEKRPQLSHFGPCRFLFWGWSSVAIVAIFFMVYLVFLAVRGAKILSMWRILDIAVSIPTLIGSFIFSVTLTAGFRQSCYMLRTLTKELEQYSCSAIGLARNLDDKQLYFYKQISVAEGSSWLATFVLLGYAAWNIGLLILISCRRKRQKRDEDTQALI